MDMGRFNSILPCYPIMHMTQGFYIKKKKDAQGFTTYRWSNLEKVEGRKADGYSIIYEEDKKNKTIYRFVNKGHLVLIGKK